jgi:hypothetical protein
MENQDFVRGFEMSAAYGSIRKVVESNVLNHPSHPLFEAGVTSLFINLNDLLQKAKAAERRITFTEDVLVPGEEDADVTDLINKARNAACHLTSAVQSVGWGRMRMNVMAGYCPRAIVTPTDTYGCDYEDDVAIQYGPIRVYLRRHALRALEEVQSVLPLS